MRRLTASAGVVAALVLVLTASAETLVIRGGTVIDGTGAAPRPNTAIIIDNGRITSIGARRVPKRARVIQAKGKYIIPGLWDMHVHLWDEDPRLAEYVRHGITGVRDMGSTYERTARWREEISTGRRIGPRIFTSGAAVNGKESREPKLPVIVAATPAQGSAAVDGLESTADYIKILSALSPEAYLAVAQRARLRRIPFAGHLPEGVPPGIAADLRQASMEHLFGLLKVPETERTALFERFRAYSVWQTPTLTLWRRDQQMQAAYGQAAQLVEAMAKAGVGILAGTDTGDPGVQPGVALHDELELLVQAGLTPMQAIQTATLNAGRFFGADTEFGTILPGRTADLVILDADPLANIRNTRRVSRVVLRGKLVAQP